MQYLDGTTGNDPLFDQPEDLWRVYIAGCAGFNCWKPEEWPMAVIDKLLWVRQNEGMKAFHRELRRAFLP